MTPPARRKPPAVDQGALANLRQPAGLQKAPQESPVLALGRPVAVPAQVEPAPEPEPAVEAVEPAPEQPRPRAVRAPARQAAPVIRKKEKVGYTVLETEADRARAAYMHTRMITGDRSFSDFIADAVAEKVRRLERKHNGGQSWTPMSAGEIPTGRPLDV